MLNPDNQELGQINPRLLVALRQNWLILAVLVLASLLFKGIEIGTHTHWVQIPLINHIIDPSLYPDDLFVSTLSRYYSVYYKLVAVAAQKFEIADCLVFAHLLSRIILFAGIFSLAYSLFRKTNIALISVLLTVFGLKAILANEEVMAYVPTHTQFAQALMPWTVMFLWQRKTLLCAVLLGLICHINLMTGLQVVMVAAITVLVNWRRFGLRRIVTAAGLWTIITAPALLWALKTPQPDVTMHEYIQVLKTLFWYHMFPLTWKPKCWIRLAGLIIVVVQCLKTPRALPSAKLMYGSLVGIALGLVTAVLFSIVPPVQPLVRLQFGRLSVLLSLIMLPSIAYTILYYISAQDGDNRLPLILLGFGWALSHGRTSAVLLILTGGWLVLRNMTKETSDNLKKLIFYRRVLAIAVLAAFVGLSLKRNLGDKGFILRSQPKDWISAQLWARDNTPKDAIFLAIEHELSFRVFSHRSVYYTIRDKDMIIWRPDITSQCLARLKEFEALGMGQRIYLDVSFDKVKSFCEEKNIDYLVAPIDLPADMQPCYVNPRWAIYRIFASSIGT